MRSFLFLLLAAFLFLGAAPVSKPLLAAPVALETGAKAAQAIPLKKIDWRHILSGEINAKGQATGFHYAGVDFVPRTARVVKSSKPDSQGVVRAKIEIFEPKSGQWIAKKSESTLFPAHWTRGQLEKEVESAYQTATLNRRLDGTAWSWRGASLSGLVIQGVVDEDGVLRTAYPIYDSKKSKAPLSNH